MKTNPVVEQVKKELSPKGEKLRKAIIEGGFDCRTPKILEVFGILTEEDLGKTESDIFQVCPITGALCVVTWTYNPLDYPMGTFFIIGRNCIPDILMCGSRIDRSPEQPGTFWSIAARHIGFRYATPEEIATEINKNWRTYLFKITSAEQNRGEFLKAFLQWQDDLALYNELKQSPVPAPEPPAPAPETKPADQQQPVTVIKD